MKTTKLQHTFRFGIFAMQIMSLVLTGAHLASHEWAWAVNYLGNFLLWTLILVLSLQRDKYLSLLMETFNFLEEIKKAEEEKEKKEKELL